MAIDNQLDENAADLRNLPEQTSQTNNSATPVGSIQHNVTKAEIILAIGILVGIVAIVYVFLQKNTSSSGPVGPLPGPWNYANGKIPSQTK